MTRKQLPLLITLLLVTLHVYASAESLYMGNVESVYSNSRFNALRNPALISMQTPDNTLGVIVLYRAFSRLDVSSEFDLDSIDNEHSETDSKDLLNGSVYLSWSKKFGKTALGIGIVSGPENQYIRRKGSGKVTGTTSVPEAYLIENEDDTTSLNPAAVFSISRATGKNSAFGFQVLSGYSREKSKSDESQYLDAVLQTRETATLTFQTWFAEIRGGYCHREGPVETGILISSGAVSLQNSEIDYYNSTIVPTDGSEHTRLHFQNRSGASITAGGFIKLSPALGFALEGKYTLPTSYSIKKYNDNTYSVYKETSLTEPFIILRGGVEYTLSPMFNFSAGVGYTMLEASSTHDMDNRSSSDIRIFFAGAGIDITMGKKTTLTAGLQMSGISSSTTLHLISASAEADADEYSITAVLGISLGF